MPMADQQSACPKKSPLTPAYAARRCATTIAISNPTSHAAAIIGPGWATHTAPYARSPESQLTARPATNAAMSDRKNPATPMVIERYRATTISLDYYGDSVLNSMSDILAMMLGFWLARKMPVWTSIALVIVLEVAVGMDLELQTLEPARHNFAASDEDGLG